MDFNNQYALLQEIYQGAAMGADAIQWMLPKVDSAAFRGDLQTQYRQYQDTATQAESQMKTMGRCPQELTNRQKAMLWMGIAYKTLANEETSHLAELMIQGSNMGIISLTKVLNSYSGTAPAGQPDSTVPAADAAAALAQTAMQNESDNISRLKCYLS